MHPSIGSSRTSLTLLAALVAVALTGFLHPPVAPGTLDPDLFWYLKMAWPARFDVVVAGDSRTLRDVSPNELEPAFPKCRIGNYAFRLTGFSRNYLDRMEGLLAPASRNPTLILGVDPHSLTLNAARDVSRSNTWFTLHGWRPAQVTVDFESEFLYMCTQPPSEVNRHVAMAPFYSFFAPFKHWEFMTFMMGRDRIPAPVACSNGWYPVRGQLANVDIVIQLLPLMYVNNPVSKEVVDELMTWIRKVRAKGIAVYGFVPPTIPEIRRLEDRVSGFDEAAFSSAFTAAGGTWISAPPKEFRTADGHHLLEPSAREFSQDLGQAIAATRTH